MIPNLLQFYPRFQDQIKTSSEYCHLSIPNLVTLNRKNNKRYALNLQSTKSESFANRKRRRSRLHRPAEFISIPALKSARKVGRANEIALSRRARSSHKQRPSGNENRLARWGKSRRDRGKNSARKARAPFSCPKRRFPCPPAAVFPLRAAPVFTCLRADFLRCALYKRAGFRYSIEV